MMELRRWSLDNGDFAAAMAARKEFARLVRSLAVPPSDVDGAELIFGELAANGVEHGAGTVTLAVRRDGSDLVLTVDDEGRGFAERLPRGAPAASTPRGRGLFFVRSLARRVDPAGQGRPATILLPVRVEKA
jgi:anti-sigma regulatory factor (Ser/Thr protein kinase)